MKKRYIIAIMTLIVILASLFALAGCNQQLNDDEAWTVFEEAMQKSQSHLNERGDYFIKYRYKERNKENELITVTQKLNVSFTNPYKADLTDFIVADRSVERASKIKTDYSSTYYGYSLKSGVKSKKAKAEDFKLGYIINSTVKKDKETKTVTNFVEGMKAEDFFKLKAGDIITGVEDKVLSVDEEVYKYTLEYVLATLDGINKDSAKIISATKNGSVATLKIVVEDDSLFYGKYNSESNCLIVQMTVGRITKISSSNDNEPVYYVNYAGPKLTLQSYNGEDVNLIKVA